MPLSLAFKANTAVPVEIEGLTPDWTCGKTLAEIERFEAFHGNRKTALAELFSVSGDSSDGQIEFEGDLSGVHRIGAHMTSGAIHVHGHAGRHVGSEMRGGEIRVNGDAGDWVGGQMHGGTIHVRGSAGNLVGSAYRGSKRGMTGGAILIDRNVGSEVGHSMRRGLITVGGECGEFVSLNMIAGTVLVFGKCGPRPAAGMRRGTLGLFGPSTPPLLNTFRKGSLYEPLMLQLIFRYLQEKNFVVPGALPKASYRIYHGDLLATGRGEILVREAN